MPKLSAHARRIGAAIAITLVIVAVSTLFAETVGAFGARQSDKFSREVAPSTSDSESGAPKEIRRLRVKYGLNAIAWNADGTLLAALYGFGSYITVWDTTTWAIVSEMYRPAGYAGNALAFLPDGTLLTSAPFGVRDASTRKLEALLPPQDKGAPAWFSLLQWDPRTGKIVHYLPADGPDSILPKSTNVLDFAVSSDGATVAGVSFASVLVYDARTGVQTHRIPIPAMRTHPDSPQAIAISPDGTEIAVCSSFGMLHFFRVADGVLLRSFTAFPHEQYTCEDVAYSPDGRLIAGGKSKVFNVADPNDLGTFFWRVADGSQVMALPNATWRLNGKIEAVSVRSLSWDRTGRLLAVGDDESLRVWKLGDGSQQLLFVKSIKRGAYSVSFSPSGMLAAANNSEVLIFK